MEKWVRGLSKTTALVIGIVSSIAVAGFCILLFASSSGIIPIIIFGAVLGGGIGFSLPLILKGITGHTPQERKELQQKVETK